MSFRFYRVRLLPATVAATLLPFCLCAQMNPGRTAIDAMRNIEALKSGMHTAEGLNAGRNSNSNGTSNSLATTDSGAMPTLTFGQFRFSLPLNCHIVEATFKTFQASCENGTSAASRTSFFINRSPLDKEYLGIDWRTFAVRTEWLDEDGEIVGANPYPLGPFSIEMTLKNNRNGSLTGIIFTQENDWTYMTFSYLYLYDRSVSSDDNRAAQNTFNLIKSSIARITP